MMKRIWNAWLCLWHEYEAKEPGWNGQPAVPKWMRRPDDFEVRYEANNEIRYGFSDENAKWVDGSGEDSTSLACWHAMHQVGSDVVSGICYRRVEWPVERIMAAIALRQEPQTADGRTIYSDWEPTRGYE